MKKILGLVILAFATVVLVACGGQSLDGKYHEYDAQDKYLYEDFSISIDGDLGTFEGEIITVNKEKKIFSAKGKEVSYIFDDAKLKVGGRLYLKEGTTEFEEAKKYMIENDLGTWSE